MNINNENTYDKRPDDRQILKEPPLTNRKLSSFRKNWDNAV